MQKVMFGALKATGIVGTLVVIGVALKILDISSILSSIAIGGGVLLGLLLGLLGVVGVAKRVGVI